MCCFFSAQDNNTRFSHWKRALQITPPLKQWISTNERMKTETRRNYRASNCMNYETRERNESNTHTLSFHGNNESSERSLCCDASDKRPIRYDDNFISDSVGRSKRPANIFRLAHIFRFVTLLHTTRSTFFVSFSFHSFNMMKNEMFCNLKFYSAKINGKLKSAFYVCVFECENDDNNFRIQIAEFVALLGEFNWVLSLESKKPSLFAIQWLSVRHKSYPNKM